MMTSQVENNSLCLPQNSTAIFSQDSKPFRVVSAITRGPGDKPPKNNSNYYQSLASQHTGFSEVAIAATSHHDRDLHHTSLERRLSDKKLVTDNFYGGCSERDNFLPVVEQPQHTKHYSKTNDSSPMNTNIGSTISFGIEESEVVSKASYVIVIDNRVRTVNTKLYASLPAQNKFIVKERQLNSKVKLVLKSFHERLVAHYIECIFA